MHVKARKVKPFVTHAGLSHPSISPSGLGSRINIPGQFALSGHEKHVPLVEGMGSSGGWIDERNVYSLDEKITYQLVPVN